MINQYKTIYNKIDKKILRPVYFNNDDELYSFFLSFIILRRSTLSCYTIVSGNNDNRLILNINQKSATEIEIKTSAGSLKYCIFVSKRNNFHYFVNDDRSIFVYVEKWNVSSIVYIIKTS